MTLPYPPPHANDDITFREFGREWSDMIPREEIKERAKRWLVNAADDDIAKFMRDRCSGPAYDEFLTRECIEYALECHHRLVALHKK